MPDSASLAVRSASLFNAAISRAASQAFVKPAIHISLAAAASVSAADSSASSESPDPLPSQSSPSSLPQKSSSSVLRSVGEQISFGSILGFATGYSIRSIGRTILFLVGTEVVILQYMAYKEWLVMDWKRVARDLSPKFDKSTIEGLVEILVYKMPFSAAFTGGLAAGLKLSSSQK